MTSRLAGWVGRMRGEKRPKTAQGKPNEKKARPGAGQAQRPKESESKRRTKK